MPSYLHRITAIVFWLFIGLALISCDSGPEKTAGQVEQITVLNDENIKQFTQAIANDYVSTQKDLLDAFYSYQKSGESYGFVKFRNHTWTPAFIKKKTHYQTVYKENSDFISKNSIKPLFLSFENLIYIGIGLKNGLLDNDDEKIKAALAEAAADKKVVLSLAK
ncbi:MAG: hypothetical protein PSN44_06975 [Gammaproteobacteria bacterium]|nr:hypothetical protein [Gammaproteobacteria bacterium]